MKTLVVSLLRLGDFLLTLPTLHALKKKNPSAELHVLIHAESLKVLPLLPFSVVPHVFDRSQLQKQISDRSQTVFEPIHTISELIESLRSESFGEVINLTQTRLSGYLCKALRAPSTVGMSLNLKEEVEFNSPWFEHLNSQTDSRDLFHFVDMYCMGSGFESAEENGRSFELKETEKGKSEWERIGLSEHSEVILLQCFSSDEKKNWKSEKWIEALSQFQNLHQGIELVLLCAPFELERARAFLDKCNQRGLRITLASLTLEGVYSALLHANLLVSVDTSIIHLANSTSIEVLELSLGSSDFRLTGPYKDDAWILQSKERCAPCAHSEACSQTSHLCGERVSPEVVALVMSRFFSQRWMDMSVISREFFTEVEILRTHLSPNGIWTASTLSEANQTWAIGEWLDRSAWKRTLQRTQKINSSDESSETIKIRRAIQAAYPHLVSSQRWTPALEKLEKTALALEERLHKAILEAEAGNTAQVTQILKNLRKKNEFKLRLIRTLKTQSKEAK